MAFKKSRASIGQIQWSSGTKVIAMEENSTTLLIVSTYFKRKIIMLKTSWKFIETIEKTIKVTGIQIRQKAVCFLKQSHKIDAVD